MQILDENKELSMNNWKHDKRLPANKSPGEELQKTNLALPLIQRHVVDVVIWLGNVL